MKSASVGEIIRIIGAVLDIRFPGGQLPEIGDAVTVRELTEKSDSGSRSTAGR